MVGLKSTLTVLPCLQRLLRKLIVCLIWSSDDDQFKVFIVQDVVQSPVHCSNNSEPFLEFSPFGLWIPLQDRVQGKQLWESEDEGYMESKAG